MRIVCLSDTHGLHQQIKVPTADLLLHAGDLTRGGSLTELANAAAWLQALPHTHKVIIAGNHDFCLQQQPDQAQKLLTGLTYLQDSYCCCDGLKIYGSPWQPWFHGWAFNQARGLPIRKIWEQIPLDCDIVMTHGPPQNILDQCFDGHRPGCQDLLERLQIVKPRLHVFGHIHEAYGKQQSGPTLHVNASCCTLRYQPVQAPILIDL